MLRKNRFTSIFSRHSIIIAFLLILPFSLNAEYTDSCGLFAQMLWSSADSYDSAKSSFESACDSYIGYSKNDESACGTYGYERTSYKNSKRELEDSLNNVANFCGPCDGMLVTFIRKSKKTINKLESEISLLKKRIKELENENKILNK